MNSAEFITLSIFKLNCQSHEILNSIMQKRFLSKIFSILQRKFSSDDRFKNKIYGRHFLDFNTYQSPIKIIECILQRRINLVKLRSEHEY